MQKIRPKLDVVTKNKIKLNHNFSSSVHFTSVYSQRKKEQLIFLIRDVSVLRRP